MLGTVHPYKYQQCMLITKSTYKGMTRYMTQYLWGKDNGVKNSAKQEMNGPNLKNSRVADVDLGPNLLSVFAHQKFNKWNTGKFSSVHSLHILLLINEYILYIQNIF